MSIDISDETYRAVLTHRMTEVEKRMQMIEEVVQKISQSIEAQKGLLVHLPAELKIEHADVPEPIDPKLLEAKSCRDKDSVKERWSEWKKLYLQGWTMQRIARRFRCDHTAVCYAKKNNWDAGWATGRKRKR